MKHLKHLGEVIGLREVVAVIGLGLVTAGLAMVYVPAALIGLGLLLFGLAVWPLLAPVKES